MSGLLGDFADQAQELVRGLLGAYTSGSKLALGAAPQMARGFTTGILGAPVDIANTLVGGVGGRAPVMGSQWIGDKLSSMGLLAPEPEDPAGKLAEFGGSFINPAGAAAGAAKAAATLKGPALAHIVFHGSPHMFDKFDMSKIGTGEGVQAYGHGLYFAENPEVATNYQRQLARSQVSVGDKTLSPAELSDALWKQSGKDDPAFLRGVMDAVHEMTTTSRAPVAPADLKSWAGYGPMPQREGYAYAAKELAGAKTNVGALYKAELKPDPEDFLQWDKPLSEQPPAIQQKLQGAYDPAYLKQFHDKPASDFYKAIAGGDHVEDLRRSASAELKDVGIPGIRYLDQGSRGAGNGTYNYVLFDDSLAKILERNGQTTGLLP